MWNKCPRDPRVLPNSAHPRLTAKVHVHGVRGCPRRRGRRVIDTGLEALEITCSVAGFNGPHGHRAAILDTPTRYYITLRFGLVETTIDEIELRHREVMQPEIIQCICMRDILCTDSTLICFKVTLAGSASHGSAFHLLGITREHSQGLGNCDPLADHPSSATSFVTLSLRIRN